MDRLMRAGGLLAVISTVACGALRGPPGPAGATGATGPGGGTTTIVFEPAPLDIVLASESPVSIPNVALTVIDCTGYESVLVNEGARPAASSAGWQPCSTAPGAISYVLTPGGGLHVLHAWGLDTQGNVSAGPADVGVALGPQMFALGNYHSCALIAGVVKCWGDNSYGELGQGTTSPTPVSTPVTVPGLGLVDAIAGGPHSQTVCALQGGQVWCWGVDDLDETGNAPTNAQCTGNGATLPCSPTPALVMLNGSPLSNVTAIAGGQYHMCATLADGTVVCWGAQDEGQLGNGQFGSSPPFMTLPAADSFASSAVVMGAGVFETCFVFGGTTLECSGLVDTDSAPDDATAALLSTDGEQLCNHGYFCQPTPLAPPALGSSALPDQIALGYFQDCARTGGQVGCWGENIYGQLGDGTLANATAATSVLLPAAADLLVSGAHHDCARLVSGEIACWGLNDVGQLGALSNQPQCAGSDCSNYPLLVAGLGPVAALGAGRLQTCAATGAGILCWGSDQWALLTGLGTDTCLPGGTATPCSHSPVTISGLLTP